MKNAIDSYIDEMGGDWTLDYQYLRDVAKVYYDDICAAHPYDQVAEKHHTSYWAVQKGMSRVVDDLWESGKEMLRRDLHRPNLPYSGPLGLARYIARAVTKNEEGW